LFEEVSASIERSHASSFSLIDSIVESTLLHEVNVFYELRDSVSYGVGAVSSFSVDFVITDLVTYKTYPRIDVDFTLSDNVIYSPVISHSTGFTLTSEVSYSAKSGQYFPVDFTITDSVSFELPGRIGFETYFILSDSVYYVPPIKIETSFILIDNVSYSVYRIIFKRMQDMLMIVLALLVIVLLISFISESVKSSEED